MDELSFHPGRPEDVDLVFAWANDPATRAASFRSERIPYDEHVRWYRDQLQAPDRNLFIVREAGEAVAVVRLDDHVALEGVGVIGINVAPERRGLGLGTRCIGAASAVAAGLGYARIYALIGPSNVASLKAFERAGYTLDGTSKVAGEDALRYVIAV